MTKVKFKPGELVHVIYYQNDELPRSHEMIVGSKEPSREDLVSIVFPDGGEGEAPREHISFTPFDFINGGFSQERPKREIKVGDWGFFYSSKQCEGGFYYGIIGEIDNTDGTFKTHSGIWFTYFSHELPELAECVPNPFNLTQNS